MKRTMAGNFTLRKYLVLFFAVLCVPFAAVYAQEGERSTADQHRIDTLRFGTEAEIASLIQTLRSENDTSLDQELIAVAETTRNRNILTGVFHFFGEGRREGLENRAIRVVQEREYETNETLIAALDYLGWMNVHDAIDVIKDLVGSREIHPVNNAVRALGRAARGSERACEVSEFLLDFYQNRSPANETQREIVVALGETRSTEGIQFLVDMIADDGERVVLRMAALESVAVIGDDSAQAAVIEAVTSSDPAVRSTAIASLGPFSGEEVEQAILDGFRDVYFRSRQGAARAAGQRRQESAVPFLRFRAFNDDVPAVRDEAIRALGAINNEQAMGILDSLFTERRHPYRIRVLAADMLLQNDADTYALRVVAEMDYANTRRQTGLYNGFIRVLTTAKSDSLGSIAHRFVTSGGIIERALALELIANNEFLHLADDVRELLDDSRTNASLARRARLTLERLGLPLEVTPEAEISVE
ncbi:MAG: HEAT repeat domain-containing protein [Treponema sp.]|nr:HEAT repeat domain-containing protein [Treponema sp.]